MTAFLSVVLASSVFVLIGALLKKDYDIIGTPLILAGVFSLVLITITAYFSKHIAYGASDAGQMQGEIALVVAIILEWIGLAWYLWATFPPKSTLFSTENKYKNI